MNVLIACEESQRVCLAFRRRGFNAFSADIQKCSGGFPQYHYKGDVLNILHTPCQFYTMNHDYHFIDSWDLVIAHPPCTFLSNAGHSRLIQNGVLNDSRYKHGLAARDFFMEFYMCDCPHICIENPIPIRLYDLPRYDQIIQPYFFGDPYYKTTCLWLLGLPNLFPTNICENPLPTTYAEWWNKGTRSERQKNRSKTFPGIANAMAAQWGDYISMYEQLTLF